MQGKLDHNEVAAAINKIPRNARKKLSWLLEIRKLRGEYFADHLMIPKLSFSAPGTTDLTSGGGLQSFDDGGGTGCTASCC
ncbi:hypothetical protein NADE_000689 [Nannochloris sp. 'desiccata']|nr:hypothetical protein NADE_000689 [Chlorella desiccata (nom. nud.)]